MAINHFKESDYSGWLSASVPPDHLGWYECRGFRFDGVLHLKWDGATWLYYGPKRGEPGFPNFGSHRRDQWRGVNPDYKIRTYLRPSTTPIDIAGRLFGALEAIDFEYRTPHGRFWLFRCNNCGGERVLNYKWALSGNTASCGCLRGGGRKIENRQDVSRPWDKEGRKRIKPRAEKTTESRPVAG